MVPVVGSPKGIEDLPSDTARSGDGQEATGRLAPAVLAQSQKHDALDDAVRDATAIGRGKLPVGIGWPAPLPPLRRRARDEPPAPWLDSLEELAGSGKSQGGGRGRADGRRVYVSVDGWVHVATTCAELSAIVRANPAGSGPFSSSITRAPSEESVVTRLTVAKNVQRPTDSRIVARCDRWGGGAAGRPGEARDRGSHA